MAIAIEEWRKGMNGGDPIVFTSNNLGVTRHPLDTHTVKGVRPKAGDRGTYIRCISDQLRSPDWHLTLVVVDGEPYYVPVHGAQFRSAEQADGGDEDQLSPQGVLGARVLDVLGMLSERSLADLRRPGGPRNNQQAQIPRPVLAQLARAFEDAYPGVLDHFVATLREQK
jgi:hypothetical protein